ncbi:MAG: hypothetical protein H5T86_10160, partial [Armatimonadetes bacterium]|nr:hypothetical protein [Armatimonadota bacterium]
MALRSFGGRQARLTVAASAIAAIVVAAVISARVLCPLASAQQSDLPQGDMQWPTYMHDRYRSGITASSLPLPLSLKWAFRAPGPPVTAWPEPPPEPVEGVLERPKVNFDDAYHVAVVG